MNSWPRSEASRATVKFWGIAFLQWAFLCFISLLVTPSAKDVLSDSPEPPLWLVIAAVCGFGLVVVVSIISFLWYRSKYRRQRFVCNTKGLTKIDLNAVAPTGKAFFVYSYEQTRLRGQYIGKWPFSLVYVLKPPINAINIDYYMLRAWYRFYSRVFKTISRTSESSSEWAVWYLKLVNKIDIRLLAYNNLLITHYMLKKKIKPPSWSARKRL